MIDYESYIRYGEPEKAQKAQNWSTAIGLQKVDGLQTSGYLNDVAIRNIEGEITVEQARHLINSYYQNLSSREAVENNVEEADRAAANINVLWPSLRSHFLFRALPPYIVVYLKAFSNMPANFAITT